MLCYPFESLKGRDLLKRMTALFLSLVLMLMMSAFAFAAEYKVVIEEPDTDFELDGWDGTFFVTGYVQANSNPNYELSLSGNAEPPQQKGKTDPEH